MSDLEFERKHLEEVKVKLNEHKQFVEERLKSLEGRKEDTAFILGHIYSRELFNLKKHSHSPYFAKLVYKDDIEPKKDVLYIGKVGFQDKDSNEIVVDWRAPISSLYYDSEVGRVSYVAPGGRKTGDLQLKRQINIEDGKVKDITDSDLMTNDELLKPYLNASADKRLKSIVATIQKEQNDIIRAPRGNVIVQGVAGSGKTTVALHRLSYLIYQMKKFDSTDDFLIIGPNKIFLKYISSVLPELDTGNVSQFTYEELALKVIGENLKIIDKNTTLKNLSEGIMPPSYLKVKNSDQYKALADEFLEAIEYSFLPEKGVTYKGVELFSRDELYKMFKICRHGVIQEDLNMLCEYISDRLKNESVCDELLAKCSKAAGNNWGLKDKWDLEKVFAKGSASFFKKQLALKKVSMLGVYKTFMDYLERKGGYGELVKDTRANLKEKKISFEDLGALVYLKEKIAPSKLFDKICNVVVDEAQDLGKFHFVALKTLFKNTTMDLYGDLNQAIHGYSSIDNWEDVKSVLGDHSYRELKKSYRTTVEIMETANLVANDAEIVKGSPVIRHGDEVEAVIYDKNSYGNVLTEEVKREIEKYSTVAILCKSPKECAFVSQMLNKYNINNTVLQNNSEDAIQGVVILTIQEAKGLEFDSVIINDASAKRFDTTDTVDMKLLYVGLTRAMHNMRVLSNGEIVKTLASLKCQKKMNVKKTVASIIEDENEI